MTYQGQARVAAIVAIGLLVITAAATLAVFVVPIPEKNETIVGQALGTLWSLLGVVVAFFYGTSTGNRKDSDTIATLAQTANAVQKVLDPNAKPDVTVAAGEQITVKADDAEKE